MPSPTARTQTWIARTVAPPIVVVARHAPFGVLMRALAAHQADHPGARYLLHVDTLPAGVDAPTTAYGSPSSSVVAFVVDEIARGAAPAIAHHLHAFVEDEAGVCAGCHAATGVNRGNGCENLCDDCFTTWEGAGCPDTFDFIDARKGDARR